MAAKAPQPSTFVRLRGQEQASWRGRLLLSPSGETYLQLGGGDPYARRSLAGRPASQAPRLERSRGGWLADRGPPYSPFTTRGMAKATSVPTKVHREDSGHPAARPAQGSAAGGEAPSAAQAGAAAPEELPPAVQASAPAPAAGGPPAPAAQTGGLLAALPLPQHLQGHSRLLPLWIERFFDTVMQALGRDPWQFEPLVEELMALLAREGLQTPVHRAHLALQDWDDLLDTLEEIRRYPAAETFSLFCSALLAYYLLVHPEKLQPPPAG